MLIFVRAHTHTSSSAAELGRIIDLMGRIRVFRGQDCLFFSFFLTADLAELTDSQ